MKLNRVSSSIDTAVRLEIEFDDSTEDPMDSVDAIQNSSKRFGIHEIRVNWRVGSGKPPIIDLYFGSESDAAAFKVEDALLANKEGNSSAGDVWMQG